MTENEITTPIIENAEPIRSMASIQRVNSLSPLRFINKETGQEEEANSIEVAKTLGWQCVVKKGNLKENELAVFFEVNSIIPFYSWSEFLRDKNRPERPIRLKTKRLKAFLSQGILLPIEDIYQLNGMEFFEGMDVTQLLGITKVEDVIDASLKGCARGNREPYIPKTDESSIQNDKSVLREFYGKPVYVSQKLDGTSFSCCWKDNEVHVCSRNLSMKEDDSNTYWAIAKQHDLPNKLKNYFEKTGIEVLVQGEIVGPKICGNKLGLTKPELYVFNIINVSGQHYYDFNSFMATCKEFNLPTVPILKECIFEWKSVDELLQEAEGKYVNGFPQEGIVIRLKENNGQHQSFKVISNKFREKTE